MHNRHIAIIKTGDTFPAIANTLGDFESWITRGLAVDPADIRVVNAAGVEPLPALSDVKGAVIAGSHAMVTDDLEWSLRIEAWLPDLVKKEIPVLGICYGHQLLARAVGGTVGFHPGGLEIGTTRVRLTKAAAQDPLFRDLPQTFDIHTCHSQTVTALPGGAVCLAENDHDPHHGFRVGPSAWGLQFHPEYDRAIMAAYVDHMRGVIREEAKDDTAIFEAVGDTPWSAKVLVRFGRLCT